jgi:MFS family permease
MDPGLSSAIIIFVQVSGAIFIFSELNENISKLKSKILLNYQEILSCSLYFQVVTVGIVVLIVDKFGRKLLLAISSFLMCISVIPLGVFFYLDEHKNCNGTITTNCEENSDINPQTVEDIGWLPLVCLIVYASAFSLGLGPLPWAVNAEMFPQEAKEKGSTIMTL